MKKNWSIPWENSILSRLLFTFLLIMTPLFITAYGIYNWGINSVRNELSETMQSEVRFYIRNLETDIQRVRVLQYDLINDENLNQLASIPKSLDNYEKTRAVLALQQRLAAIKNSSKYLKDVSVYTPSTDEKISAVNGISKLPEVEFRVLETSGDYSGAQIINWEDKLLLSALSPQRDNKKKYLFAIGIEISSKAISEMLIQIDDKGEGGYLLINPIAGLIGASGDYEDKTDEILASIKLELPKAGSGKKTVMIKGISYLVFFNTSDYLNMTLCRFMPEVKVYNSMEKYQAWLWVFSIISVLIIILYSVSTYKFIHQPLKVLISSLKKAEKGNLDIVIDHKRSDEFSYLYKQFNSMIKNLNYFIDQVYKQKILTQRAELKQLQAQINPHFLYNSFFILQRRINSGDYENAQLFSEQLGEYFRFVTRNAPDEIPLRMEVEHARIYTNIQAYRFSSRIKIEFHELLPEFEELSVPRLIMQPVIENAFEHGLEKKLKDGILLISFYKKEEILYISIEDNGDQLSDKELETITNRLGEESADKEITGIINIHRRIRLKFGEKSGVTISRSHLGGIKVEIGIELTRRE